MIEKQTGINLAEKRKPGVGYAPRKMPEEKSGNFEGNVYDVSVIVVTYNPQWEAEAATLDSILKQTGISFEIVVTDDGSKDNHFDLVKDYFAKNGFTHFKLVNNPINKGTVRNVYSGLVEARGKYVKTISPGDMLYKNDTLCKWFAFMETNQLAWTFSDVIYYKSIDSKVVPVSVKTHPRNISLYRKGSDEDIRWQYVALDDIAVGASLMSLRDLQIKYMDEILDKVIYAEDNIWRMMMFDGIVGRFYDDYTVLYEYGTGVSTSKSSVWAERLQNDWENTDKILSAGGNIDAFQLKMLEACHAKGKIKKLWIKGKLRDRLFDNRKSIDYLP